MLLSLKLGRRYSSILFLYCGPLGSAEILEAVVEGVAWANRLSSSADSQLLRRIRALELTDFELEHIPLFLQLLLFRFRSRSSPEYTSFNTRHCPLDGLLFFPTILSQRRIETFITALIVAVVRICASEGWDGSPIPSRCSHRVSVGTKTR
jgi:hypothetical protein